mmetsp:Transcript_40582/g.81788  ORF Transcript_40582/g.81788 Transcript_40582/m.81788 type:complete len:509 (-) Transcript_40582:182-1708(-)
MSEKHLGADERRDRLIAVRLGDPDEAPAIRESHLRALCVRVQEAFLEQDPLLELSAPIQICGDIRGHFNGLLRLLATSGFPPAANYLFLGNYVGHGTRSIETLALLFAYKVRFPCNFFMLRGNHECAFMTRGCGFYDECKRRYSAQLWKAIDSVFNCMPVCALIEEKIICMNSGLSPELNSMDQIQQLARPATVPDSGILCDLLWARPDNDVTDWEKSDMSLVFGSDVVSQFLAMHNLDLVVCANRPVGSGKGYEFLNAGRQLLTVWSAPRFGDAPTGAAIVTVDETLLVGFKVLKPDSGTTDACLGPQFGALLDSGLFTDVVVHVEKEEIHAHSSVLAARSPVFKAMWLSSMREQQQKEVIIKDLEPCAVKRMLRFMYVGALDVELESDGEVITLLEAAHQYQVASLVELCVAKLSSWLTVENAAEYLMIAEHAGLARLRRRCLDFISSTHRRVAELQTTKAFARLAQKRPHLLAEILAEAIPPVKRARFEQTPTCGALADMPVVRH